MIDLFGDPVSFWFFLFGLVVFAVIAFGGRKVLEAIFFNQKAVKQVSDRRVLVLRIIAGANSIGLVLWLSVSLIHRFVTKH